VKHLLFFFVIASIIVSCDLSDPEDVDKAEIEDILNDIVISYTFLDLEGIMGNYHPDFLHGADSYNSEQIIWEIRQNEYDVMSIADIYIELNDNFATAFFTLTFDEQTTQEPSTEFGDMSYFYREYDDWKICGKNFTQP